VVIIGREHQEVLLCLCRSQGLKLQNEKEKTGTEEITQTGRMSA
jgi:hypothetical protein